MTDAGMGCACSPDMSALATNLLESRICVVCGALRCAKCCRVHTCCIKKQHVPATAILAKTLGPKIMACGAGCMGGKIHKTGKCPRLKRLKNKDANIIFKNGVVVQTRGSKKKWRLMAAPTHKAEVWKVKTEKEDGVPAETSVVVGPAFPGTLLPVQGTATEITRIAKVKIEVEGKGFVPKATKGWGSLNRETWTKFAKSSCAWSRLFLKVAPQVPEKATPTYHRHAALSFEGPIVAQMPPTTFERNGLVRCAYCGTAYKTLESYVEKCAPDALL